MPTPQPYPHYKPSNIPWLGNLPEHWDVRRLTAVAKIIGGATPPTNVPNYWEGPIHWLTPDDLGKLTARYIESGARRITQEGYDSCGATLAPAGSIAISTRAPIGHIGILLNPACVNQGCRLLSPNDNINSDFIYFCLESSKGQLGALGQGSTFTELSRKELGNFPIPLPPLPEQAAIVRYLDHVDRRIRRYVGAKGRLIALLEEEKQAVVNRAVTRGLDPNVPLKPSGVAWLGDVPAHWEVGPGLSELFSVNGLIGISDDPQDLTQAPKTELLVLYGTSERWAKWMDSLWRQRMGRNVNFVDAVITSFTRRRLAHLFQNQQPRALVGKSAKIGSASAGHTSPVTFADRTSCECVLIPSTNQSI